MDNEIKIAFGNAPNSEWVLDPDGVVLVRRTWSNPVDLRADLESIIGSVQPHTRVEDLDMPTAPPPEPAKTGVLEPLQKPRMRPLRIEPIAPQGATDADHEPDPFYVKLRAEGDRELLGHGEGQLYLAFRPGPALRGPLEQRGRADSRRAGGPRHARPVDHGAHRAKGSRRRPTPTRASSSWTSSAPIRARRSRSPCTTSRATTQRAGAFR